MDKKSKIFFQVFFFLVVVSIGVSYYKFVVIKDYAIRFQAECNPETEACFVDTCDPEAEECIGDVEQDISYYKIIQRKAYRMPLCDPNEEYCQRAMVCQKNEEDCEVIFCSDEAVEESGATCSDPETYLFEHNEAGEETGELSGEVLEEVASEENQ